MSRIVLRLLWLVLPVLLTGNCCLAQHFVQLTRKTSGRVRIFEAGDRVRFRLRNAPLPGIERGRIEVVTDSGMWVNERHIRLDSLSYIGEGGLGIRIAAGTVSVIGGVLLLTHISGESNYGVVQFIIGQVLTGVGLLEIVIHSVKLFTTARYDLDRKWKPEIRRYRTDPG